MYELAGIILRAKTTEEEKSVKEVDVRFSSNDPVMIYFQG